MKQSWKPVIVFCFIHVLIFFVIFGIGLYGDYYRDDFTANYLYFHNLIHGRVPYLNYPVEYPPLGMAFILLPGLISGAQPQIYAQVFSIQILLFDLVGLLVVAAIAQRLCSGLWKTLGVCTLALLGIGPLITVRYDLIPAVMTLLAIYAFIRGNHKVSWALLALGTLTKLYPIIIAPVFLLYHLCHHRRRDAVIGLVVFFITSAIIVTPIFLISAQGFLQSFTYHVQRGLQSESTYASLLLLGQVFGLTSVDLSFSFGSTNIVSPLADIMANVSLPIMLLSLIAVYWFFYRTHRTSTNNKATSPISQFDSLSIINYSFLAILAFMITNKVLSPQFVIWLCPLIPLVIGRARNVLWLLFVMIGLMTYFIYEYGAGIENVYPPVVGVLFTRNMLLIVLVFLLEFRRQRLTYLEGRTA